MDSIKALKKLKKKSTDSASSSQKQLALLKKQPNHARGENQRARSLGDDIKSLSIGVTKDIVSELAVPLNPLLSWFGESTYSFNRRQETSSDVPMKPIKINTIGQSQTKNQSRSLAAVPLKNPPCKKCPALASGLCKCAMKKFDVAA